MRILHTADWHLGHTLHELDRELEHDAFLAWLTSTLHTHAVDALLIAGDVFETANPPASAQRRWYRLLATLRAELPRLEIVVVGGNHDSAARLDAPRPILEALRVHVVGGLPRDEAGRWDPASLLLPLHGADGEIAAWCVAMPYLRTADLPAAPEGAGDPLIDGVRRLYTEAVDLARERRQPGQALVLMGHCYMVGTAISDLSERRILGGNQHALPADIFPADVSYVALGHLHKAQAVGGRPEVRYSGSPLPLSFTEVDYSHQVLRVDLDGEAPAVVTPLPVPRAVEMLRIPPAGPRPWEEVEPLLRRLPARLPGQPEATRPWLEVRVELPRPRADLKARVEEALEGRAARLVKLSVSHTGDGAALGDRAQGRDLKEISPDEVFRLLYQRQHQGDPPPDLLEAFHTLVEQAQQGLGEGGAP